jgi:hypothetical protein
MESAFEILNQPIVITLITLFIGSYAISLIMERRARRNKLRDQAVEFITEAGISFNQFFPHLYGRLRTGRLEWDQTLEDELIELFSKRMWIQIGSQAYLKSDTFHTQYFQLLDEVIGVVQSFRDLGLDEAPEELSKKIRENRIRLVSIWPLEDEVLTSSSEGASNEVIIWLDAIMHRVTALLVESLDLVLRGNF